MYNRINEELSQCMQNWHRAQKIDAMVESLTKDTYILEEKVRNAKAVMDKENRDYEKMTEVSISSIFYSVLGKHEDRTEKEYREALDAELKYNQAVDELEDVRARIDTLKRERSQYRGAQEKYGDLYKRKLKMLTDENGAAAQSIMELNSRMERSRSNMQEIDEARSVGGRILSELDNAAKNLDDAEGWGVWDMVGGGFIADLVKHSHIDSAGYSINRIQSLISEFKTELADVRVTDDINIGISGFSKFADFFFDGLIADWFMQSKINAAQNSVGDTYRQVTKVMDKLKELKDAEENTIAGLKNELDRLVAGGF